MRILLPTLHVRRSAQAIALAAGNLKACLTPALQQQTELIDLFPEQSIEQMLAVILERQPQLVAFPLYLWNRARVLQLCRQLRLQQPGLILLAGGPEASADPNAVVLEGQLDGVVCGEGETCFSALVESLSKTDHAGPIPGFFSAQSDSQPQPAPCPDLNQLPSPWLSGVLSLQPGCGVLWEVARGCSFNCAFCYDAKGQRGVRPLPLSRLRSELRLFAEQQVAQVWILDSTFNAPPQRGKQLLCMLLEEAPQIHYHLEAKADFLDAETADLLSQLSCSVQIGLQSANPEVLKPLNRNINPRQMSRALSLLSERGVTFGLDLIYGLPGDSHRGFCDSLNYALSQQPNQVDIFPLAVLPGTELQQHRASFGLEAESVAPYLVQSCASYPVEELEQSRQLALAADIFYNRGRAVGFFTLLCDALQLQPVELLETFSRWLQQHPQLDEEKKSSAECWQVTEILPIQQAFVAEQLGIKGQKKLQPLAEDLLNYHYCCAELLLAQECQPAVQLPDAGLLQKQLWKLTPAVQVQVFHYPLDELEQVGGARLSQQFKQLRPELNYGIFLRQEGDALIEMLDESFARMLLRADGKTPTPKLLAGFDRQDGLELLEFAVGQGLLIRSSG